MGRNLGIRARVISLAAASCLLVAGVSRADLETLLRKIPRGANALVVVDGPALRNSPLLKQTAGKVGPNYYDLLNMPTDIEQLVVASRIDFSNLADSDRVALAVLKQDRSLAEVATREGGQVEEVGGTDAVWSPRNAYLGKLGPHLFGLIYPSDRQAFARWIKYAATSQINEVPPYLRGAAALAGAESPYVMAIELIDATSPARALRLLQGADSLRAHQAALPAAAQLLATVKGATFRLSLNERPEGIIIVQFGAPTQGIAAFAKPMLLEVLAAAGASIEDLKTWTTRPDGNLIVFSGPLSPDGLRRFGSLLALPVATQSGIDPVDMPASSRAEDPARATKRYYDAVTSIIDDLKQNRTMIDGRPAESEAVWYDRYAERVDQLPILNVDPEMIDFGDGVTQRLRALAQNERGLSLNISYRRTTSDSSQLAVSQIKRQEKTSAKGFKQAIFTEIDQASSGMRKGMTQKYKIEF